jgi:hypothetical protein
VAMDRTRDAELDTTCDCISGVLDQYPLILVAGAQLAAQLHGIFHLVTMRLVAFLLAIAACTAGVSAIPLRTVFDSGVSQREDAAELSQDGPLGFNLCLAFDTDGFVCGQILGHFCTFCKKEGDVPSTASDRSKCVTKKGVKRAEAGELSATWLSQATACRGRGRVCAILPPFCP